MANRYTFSTQLEGFIKVDEDGGQYNNRTFSFAIPKETLTVMEADREELLEWGKTKAPNPKRVEVALPKWDEETSIVKYSYSKEDSRKVPVFVDSDGKPCTKETLQAVRKGTKANVIVQQSPYVYGSKVGTKFLVKGVQIVELATGNGAVDSGDLSVEDVAALFGSVDGFKQDDPQVRQAEPVAAVEDSYDF